MIHENIKKEVGPALLAKDEVRLRTVRSLIAAFTNELVAKRRKPTELLTDKEAVAVIARAAKQRQDSIEQFTAGGRMDLVDQETAELKIIETYLPKLMSQDEIRVIAQKTKDDLEINDKSKAGLLMSALMKELKGKAAGADVKAVVGELLQ